MNIIVVGCGRVGSALAHRLYLAGHQVAVVDRTAEAFSNLPPDFAGRLHEGDALAQDILSRAGIENTHAMAVVTNSDALNAVVGHIAQVEYKVPTVVVRNYDPRFRPLFEEFNLQVVSSTSWGAQRIEELLYDAEMHTVFSAGNGEVEVYEFVVPPEWIGKRATEIFSGRKCNLLSTTRAGRAIQPDEDLVFDKGDVLHVSATFAGINELRARLSPAGQES